MKGFSLRNLKYIRQWYQFFSDHVIGQQAVTLLVQIPWSHNIQIITKYQSIEEAIYYIRNTVEYGWSRNVLVHQIESGLWQQFGKTLHTMNLKQYNVSATWLGLVVANITCSKRCSLSDKEQTQLAEFIDTKTTKFDILIQKSLIGIELMKECRTALIPAVVTGKIDMRNWQIGATS